MDSYREQIDEYLIMLSGPDAEDAWHSLREMGPSALPCMIEAFHSIDDPIARVSIVEIIGQYRSANALSFLAELLDDHDAKIWKTALDGLVTLGGEQAIAALRAWRVSATPDKREWCDEALQQVADESGA